MVTSETRLNKEGGLAREERIYARHPSARHMQDRIRLGGFTFQNLDGPNCGQDEQFNSAPFGFPLHFLHHRKRACASANHEAAALPRYRFLEGKRRVPEFGAEFFGRLFLAFAYPPTVNHHIVLVRDPIDANGTEGKIFKPHTTTSLRALYSLTPGSTATPTSTVQPMTNEMRNLTLSEDMSSCGESISVQPQIS